jgi:hypothetical protein
MPVIFFFLLRGQPQTHLVEVEGGGDSGGKECFTTGPNDDDDDPKTLNTYVCFEQIDLVSHFTPLIMLALSAATLGLQRHQEWGRGGGAHS